MTGLDAPLTLRLPARTAKRLAAVGIETVGDLLGLAPRRYYRWGALTPLSILQEGEDVTILAEVVSAKLVANRSRGGVRFEVGLTDGFTRISATFFAANEYKLIPHQKLLTPGASFLFAGKVGSYRGRLQLTHPSFEGADGDLESAEERSRRPIPIYPGGSGLTSWIIARAVDVVLEHLDDADVPDVVPAAVRERYGLLERAEAFRRLHRPNDDDDYRLARRTFAFEEALVLQCALVLAREGEDSAAAPASPEGSELVSTFLAGLPFELTDSQRAALAEIGGGIADERPMQRLLQGDVGSGKTVVALAALLQVLDAGHQGALVAPTEVLASQHLDSMRALVAPLAETGRPVDIRLLTGATSPAARRQIAALMASGAPLIVVGTHALLQEGVEFADLGLVVVDEQHRFGVAQRDRLRAAGERAAHQLVMTATPIPRTIAMTVFGDLEETRMKGMPAGRTPVATHLVDAGNTAWMERLWERAREEIATGGRVYVVCPRIDEDDPAQDPEDAKAPLASVEAVARTLRTSTPLKDVGVTELTGRTSPADKAAVMTDFASGVAPVLVATTVIEVGVDVPEATMMVILDAQQFGISQLHQLRGRVGRSDRASICMAVYRHGIGADAMERLRAFAESTNGFELAEKDLELRREGDVLGAEQSGRTSHLRFLSVRRDARIISDAREEARAIIATDPRLATHPALLDALARTDGLGLRWLSRT